MHVRWNYPPCIQRCNKECLPFNTTLMLQGFIPGFSVTSWPRDTALPYRSPSVSGIPAASHINPFCIWVFLPSTPDHCLVPDYHCQAIIIWISPSVHARTNTYGHNHSCELTCTQRATHRCALIKRCVHVPKEPMRTPTCTATPHTNTYAETCKHTCLHTCMLLHTHICIQIYTYTPLHKCSHTKAHIYMQLCPHN